MSPRLSLNPPVVTTLLELADATSHNLDFAHRPGLRISYGEETITETNLLEITRRHPQRTRLQMFSKHQEALNGTPPGVAHRRTPADPEDARAGEAVAVQQGPQGQAPRSHPPGSNSANS